MNISYKIGNGTFNYRVAGVLIYERVVLPGPTDTEMLKGQAQRNYHLFTKLTMKLVTSSKKSLQAKNRSSHRGSIHLHFD